MKEQDMTQRYRNFQRAWGMYHAFDTVTGNSVSLKTKDKAHAHHLVVAMNQASQQAAMNVSLAKVYFRHSDPLVANRTWQTVIDEIIRTKTGENQIRWQVMAKSKWLDPLRNRLLIETQAEHLLRVLQCGKVATNIYLRRLHNFAIDMNWLPASVVPKRQWPVVKFKDKRAITFEEHQNIIAAEQNPDGKVFYLRDGLEQAEGLVEFDVAHWVAFDVIHAVAENNAHGVCAAGQFVFPFLKIASIGSREGFLLRNGVFLRSTSFSFALFWGGY